MGFCTTGTANDFGDFAYLNRRINFPIVVVRSTDKRPSPLVRVSYLEKKLRLGAVYMRKIIPPR